MPGQLALADGQPWGGRRRLLWFSLVVLVVQGTDPELFRSAKADVNTEYAPLIASIAAVILENAEVITRTQVGQRVAIRADRATRDALVGCAHVEPPVAVLRVHRRIATCRAFAQAHRSVHGQAIETG